MKKRAMAAPKRAVVRCSFIQAAYQINILFAKNHIDLVNVRGATEVIFPSARCTKARQCAEIKSAAASTAAADERTGSGQWPFKSSR